MNKRFILNVLLPSIVGAAVIMCVIIFIAERRRASLLEQPEFSPPPITTQYTEPEDTTSPPPPANSLTAEDFTLGENGYLTCTAAESLLGVDVSEYQGDIDWQEVKDAGIDFAIIRVGFRGYGEAGKIVEDENARYNLQSALDAGLQVGAYFFSQATSTREAVQEAQFALGVLQGYDVTMPVVFDWEYVGDYARTADTDPETVTACAKAFCDTVALAGYEPMFYSNQNLGDTHFDLYALSDYPMWLAMYDRDMDYPHRLYMWQYTASGQVPGIEGDVDLNLYMMLDEKSAD